MMRPKTGFQILFILHFITLQQPWMSHCSTTKDDTMKESIVKQLKQLGNGHTMLPYFSFFSKREMQRQSFEEALSIRAEKIPVILQDEKPTRSRAELTFLKAISNLRKEKHVWKISLIALLLEKMIEPEPPVAKLQWWKGPERVYITNIIKMFDGTSSPAALQNDVTSLMKAADEQQEIVRAFERNISNSKHKKTLSKKNFIPHAISLPTWIQPTSGNDLFRNWFNAGKNHHRTKRSTLAAKHVGDTVCVEEGTGTDTHARKSSLTRLCGACVKDIDLGPEIIPRYVKSVECNGGEPTCLMGDGVCIQKIMYTTFQRSTRNKNGDQIWKPYKLPLNTSCECQCRMGSLTQTYFMT